jgi:hypothetical protein
MANGRRRERDPACRSASPRRLPAVGRATVGEAAGPGRIALCVAVLSVGRWPAAPDLGAKKAGASRSDARGRRSGIKDLEAAKSATGIRRVRVAIVACGRGRPPALELTTPKEARSPCCMAGASGRRGLASRASHEEHGQCTRRTAGQETLRFRANRNAAISHALLPHVSPPAPRRNAPCPIEPSWLSARLGATTFGFTSPCSFGSPAC